jgi:hypothetical protein
MCNRLYQFPFFSFFPLQLADKSPSATLMYLQITIINYEKLGGNPTIQKYKMSEAVSFSAFSNDSVKVCEY